MPLRSEVTLEELLKPLLVVAVALIGADGRVLMQQRPLSAVHGGLWEFPGGKVEAGETPEKAAVRELHEELGIGVPADSLVPVAFASGHTVPPQEGGKGPLRPLVILLYAAAAWKGIPRALEAADLAWLAPEEIAMLPMPPLDYPLARGLCRHLNGSEQIFSQKSEIAVDHLRFPS